MCCCQRLLVLIFFTFSAVPFAHAQVPTSRSRGFTDYQDANGEAMLGLQPRIFIGASRSYWTIDIDYIAKTDVPSYAWIQVTNRVGSKLRLWLTNGVEVIPKSSDALGALRLPALTTVSNIMAGSWMRGSRAGQWLMHWGAKAGEDQQAGHCLLGTAFGMAFTNDVVLEITPLLYRVETNRITAHLVEFPPIKVKLFSNGTVQEIRARP